MSSWNTSLSLTDRLPDDKEKVPFVPDETPAAMVGADENTEIPFFKISKVKAVLASDEVTT